MRNSPRTIKHLIVIAAILFSGSSTYSSASVSASVETKLPAIDAAPVVSTLSAKIDDALNAKLQNLFSGATGVVAPLYAYGNTVAINVYKDKNFDKKTIPDLWTSTEKLDDVATAEAVFKEYIGSVSMPGKGSLQQRPGFDDAYYEINPKNDQEGRFIGRLGRYVLRITATSTSTGVFSAKLDALATGFIKAIKADPKLLEGIFDSLPQIPKDPPAPSPQK